MIVLFVEQLKTMIKSANESKVKRQNKRMIVLSNALQVVNWINSFDPQNINNDDLKMPKNMLKVKKIMTNPSHRALSIDVNSERLESQGSYDIV